MIATRIAWVVLAGIALAGCKLVDQTTFAPSPEPVPEAPTPPPQVDPRTPLVTIGYDSPDPHYHDLLHYAVRAAESRAPGVQYDVIAMVPTGGDVALGQSNSVEVMRTIAAEGVPVARIHLGLRLAPAGAPRQVRVYVR